MILHRVKYVLGFASLGISPNFSKFGEMGTTLGEMGEFPEAPTNKKGNI